jgi:hypothetical protein
MRVGLSALLLIAWAAEVAAAQTINAEPVSSALISPDKGSVSVSADPGACATSTRLTLATVTRRLNPNGRTGTSRSGVATAPVSATCRWRIDGLETREYEVDLSGPGGSGGIASFTPSPGTLQEIQIPSPSVRVTGTVRINGRPAEGVRLQFVPVSASLPQVTTNAAGAFNVTLPNPGQYRARIIGDSVFSQGTAVTFEAGAQNWNWDINGGTVTVQIVAAGAANDLDFYFEWGGGAFAGGRVPSGRTQLVRHGVPAGTYQLSLKRNGKRVSNVTEITIENPGSSVEVVLRESR